MDASTTSRSATSSGASADVETMRLCRPASLLWILALSLGLWTIIWAAAVSMASMLAG